MDCFYAAIEVRDRPELRGKPVGVGGARDRRGVLTTCNYEARKFGVRSAMPTFMALQRCPKLIVLPTRFDVYRREAAVIRAILHRFTPLVEPLSLDEAYLDVSAHPGAPGALAQVIRNLIFRKTKLTASAGIGPNKLVAKIASDLNKPNGQCEVAPNEVPEFMAALPVRKIWGIGAVTEQKLQQRGITTCGELQRFTVCELLDIFGKFGAELYDLCRGIDERPVEPDRERKSLSTEETFASDLETLGGLRGKAGGTVRGADGGSGAEGDDADGDEDLRETEVRRFHPHHGGTSRAGAVVRRLSLAPCGSVRPHRQECAFAGGRSPLRAA